MIILQNESKKMKRLHLEKNDDPHLDASVQGVEAPLENACQDETNVGGQTTEIETVQEPLLKDEAKNQKPSKWNIFFCVFTKKKIKIIFFWGIYTEVARRYISR